MVLSFLAVFGNAALLIASGDALRGRPVGVRTSCARAAARVRAIAVWAPIGAVQLLGALLLVGMAWLLGSYLAVPAMVLDGAGVREAMRRSRETYRRDRAEFMRGTTGLTAPFLLTFLPSVAVFFVGLTTTGRGLGAVLMGCAVPCLGAGATVTASLFGVFRARLYLESKGAVIAAEPVRSAAQPRTAEGAGQRMPSTAGSAAEQLGRRPGRAVSPAGAGQGRPGPG